MRPVRNGVRLNRLEFVDDNFRRGTSSLWGWKSGSGGSPKQSSGKTDTERTDRAVRVRERITIAAVVGKAIETLSLPR